MPAPQPAPELAATPADFEIDCAVWNLGMPCEDSFSKQPRKVQQGLDDSTMLLRRACIVGINEIHPAHQDLWDTTVTSNVPNTTCYGSISGNMLFWCLPQYLLTMPSGRHSLCRPPPGLFNHFFACL